MLKQVHIPYISACHLQIDADQDPDPVYHFDADPDADPDPAYHFDADPDPSYHLNEDADPDPTFQFDADPCGSGYTTLVDTYAKIFIKLKNVASGSVFVLDPDPSTKIRPYLIESETLFP